MKKYVIFTVSSPLKELIKRQVVKRRSSFQSLGIKVTLAYAFWSSLWILLSDQALKVLFSGNPDLLIQISTIKGWLFTFITSILLYGLIRKGEKARSETLQLLQDVIEGTSDAIFVKDRESKYILINGSGANFVGKPISEIIGQDDSALFSAEDVPKIRQFDQEIMNSGCSQQVEETITANGQTLTYISSKFPRFDVQGNVIGLIGISRNITERKQLEQEREQLLKDLEARNEELNALNLITANAISTLELDPLLSVLLDRIVNVVEADAALIFLEDQGTLPLKAQMGKIRAKNGENTLYQEIARVTLTTKQIINIEDIQQDPRFSQYASQNENKRHIIGIPLQRQKQQVGVLEVVWNSPHGITEREIHLLEVTAERCTMAILNAQLFEQTKSLQEYLQLQFERAPIGYILHDFQGYFTDWNPAAENIFGYQKSEVIGKHPYELIVPATERSYVEDIIQRLSTGEMNAHGLNQNVTKSGKTITCQWHNTPLFGNDGEFLGILCMVEDVTERISLQQQLREYAYYDAITKLPTRTYLKEQLITKLETATTLPKFALLHLDLVRFKTIKYTLGYQIAEELLVQIKQRFQSQLPNNSILAKIGSDEFAILLEDVETLDQATHWVEHLLQCFSSPFEINEQRLFTTMKVGLVLTGQWYGSAEELLQAAETAMHQAKFSNTQDYAVFDPKMQESAIARLQLDSEMRKALEQGEFELHYQPIIDLQTQALTGLEALLRWQKDGKWVSPAEFIPVAEDTGFIIPLDEWVLRQACWQMQQWCLRWNHSSQLWMSVNVSVIELVQPDFLDRVDAILQETNLAAQQLKLEITETAVMENAEKVSSVLQKLKERNILLCLDDFGTGYSSLSYLREFPFDVMKVDRAFISNLEPNSKHFNLIRTMMLLANDLEMGIIVEGIETQQQLEQLKQLGCQEGQGYLFTHPLPATGVEALLAQDNWIIPSA
ncbi:diguanylate cyclase/phosphodiesterase with PAS/PAC and GAF sensor(s) [Halothece sp. PCC 7418]|nr:diguanylate cyclase/phosphodiesterase with PAS/PAC and GAF sensor(s) [Halothece sp. PCC 7418]